MRFEHTTHLQQPADLVIAWHERPGALVRLTPPGLGGPEDPAAGGMASGRRVGLRMGPPLLPDALRPRWVMRHEDAAERLGSRSGSRPIVPPAGGEPIRADFVDVQLSGPFRQWRQGHTILGDETSSRVEDVVEVELPGGISCGEGIVRDQVERLFAFRGRQLEQDLDFHSRHAAAPRLTVAIAGASGLIGTQLAALLETGGHTVRRMVRGRSAGAGEISWDPARGVLDPAVLEGVDAVVNLAGRSIATRMTPRAKQEILSSRVSSSQLIARTLATLPEGARPRTLIQASAIGIYGAQRPGELLTEADDLRGEGFLAEVTRAWQEAARPAEDAGIRVVHVRTGIVLSDGGGSLLPQLPLYLLGAGGRMGDPEAVVSWITLDDMARAYAHLLLSGSATGPMNVVAPEPATQAEFARTLGKVLHRPALLPVPAAGPRLLLGREGSRELVEADQRVSDAALISSGFEPRHRDLETALRHVLRR